MHPNAEAYFTANEQRRRQWEDKHLSAPLCAASEPEPKAKPARSTPAFPPATPRPWSRPFVRPQRKA